MRKIYEYLSIEEKKEAVEKLREDLRKLKKEIDQNQDSFSSFILEILYSTRDKWNLEMEELEAEIKDKNNEYLER
ncbi:hypothetical protein [Bacillus smithii]|uniref:Uncharacterized protein n=2 Tax=Bacillus TaxID=1386 RepID=G9QJD4_9BACI|nr:hypothetical protein [Bacillus smithii]EHL78736.1 hypothetical protein HMPREF1015_02582 [Bacillus smithii 7_3_47FAA]